MWSELGGSTYLESAMDIQQYSTLQDELNDPELTTKRTIKHGEGLVRKLTKNV